MRHPKRVISIRRRFSLFLIIAVLRVTAVSESPCNVKLSSFRGLERGGFGDNPYSLHFDDYPRTGMEAKATTEEWREVGFYPVVSRGGSAKENLAGSMVSQLVRGRSQLQSARVFRGRL